MTARPEAPTLDDDKHAKMRDMVMTWEEISDELIWGDYDVNGPDIQKIDPDRLEAFCKRFPHFEGQLRSFVDDWNREPMITQEMLAAIEHTEVSQEEIDKSWRSAKRILDFYTKLRSVEKERDELRGRLRAIEQAAVTPNEVWEFEGDFYTHEHGCVNNRDSAELLMYLTKRIRAIEQSAGMPDKVQRFDRLSYTDSSVRIDVVAAIDYDALADHTLHLADKLARMEALLREPDEEMFNALTDRMWKDHTSSTVWKAMSAALLAKLEKEK